MKAGEIIFRHLLDTGVQYRVPLFQRTYSWEEDQWEQLWDDLLEIYAMDKPRNHFIGSVVTQPIPGPAENVSKYLLIDGQQRMTTLLILLSVIRHHAQQGPDPKIYLSEEIEDRYLFNRHARLPDERIKLMPTRRDIEPFNVVINGGVPSSDTQIGRSWLYFDRSLRQKDLDGNEINLETISDCIVAYLDMVSITLGNDDSPNRIFESLNNTGMPLSVSDLIRNYLFMNIREWDKQEYAHDNFWFPMQETLSGWWLSDFFWRYLMMDGSLPRQDETFDGVRQSLGQAPTSTQTVEALKRFHKFSRYYAQISERDISGMNDSLLDQIHRLNQWGVDVARPFLMKGLDYVYATENPITEEEFIKVMNMIESFVVRRAVCGIPTHSLRRYFTQMSVGVDFSNFRESSREHLLDRNWPSDDAFCEAFIRFQLYVPSRLKRTRLILDSLELSFEGKEAPEFTPEITIEHIMPQTLSDEWKESLGSNAKEIHDQWLHTVGNLTLTGYNPALGNMPFLDKKKKVFAEANFKLSSSLKKLDKWNAITIERRGRELAERALQIWPR